MTTTYDIAIFGKAFRQNRKQTDCVIGYMMRKGIINGFDGKIHEDKLRSINKFMLWSYLYYLWVHNNESEGNVFENVSSYRFKKHFVSLLETYCKDVLESEGNFRKNGRMFTVTKEHLYLFVNDVIQQNRDSLFIPFLVGTEMDSEELRKLDVALDKQLEEEMVLMESLSKFINNPPSIQIKTELVGDTEYPIPVDEYTREYLIQLRSKLA
jgi:hypothetical protein